MRHAEALDQILHRTAHVKVTHELLHPVFCREKVIQLSIESEPRLAYQVTWRSSRYREYPSSLENLSLHQGGILAKTWSQGGDLAVPLPLVQQRIRPAARGLYVVAIYSGRTERTCSLVLSPRLRLSPKRGRVSPCAAISRPAQRLLTLRPTSSQSRLCDRFIGSLSGFVTSTAVPIATGWNEPVPGRKCHPLRTSVFHGTHSLAT